MPDDNDINEQLAAIEADEAAARAADALEEQRKKIERHALKKKFEATLGKEKVDFLIVNTGGGYVVVKKGESVLYKAILKVMATPGITHASPEYERYAAAHVVHPDKDGFAAILEKWPGCIHDIVASASYLHGMRAGDTTSK